MNPRAWVRDAWRWIAARQPRTFSLAAWVVFLLGCYPGYLSTAAVLQLYTVRSGEYSDYSPLMTAVWGVLEYVIAGPFPMLALQSLLFLFGLSAILRTILTPRVAAVTAGLVLLFPPVFSTMAVIWPEPLMTGALLAAVGAALQGTKRWNAVAILCAILAVSCHGELAFALAPLAFIALPDGQRWKRAGIAIAIVVAITVLALGTNRLLTVTDTYQREQTLYMMDIAGTLRRAKLKKEPVLLDAVNGMPLADPPTFKAKLTGANDALNWYALAHGDKRVFEPLTTDDQADATAADWRRVIAAHPKAYLTHRFAMLRALLALRDRAPAVFDDFGSVDLLAPLHHRAIPSDWEIGMRAFVRAVAKTPLFRPVLYLVLVIVAIVLARKQRLLRNLAISGLVFELMMFLFAQGSDYRYSHWMITTACIVLTALAVSRRSSWRLPSPS